MQPDLFIANSDADIAACFPAFSALRPSLKQEEFVSRVRRQQAQSYQILALRHEGSVTSAAGFRFGEYLAWGKILYIDDLTTLPDQRARGAATLLLDWLIAHAKEHGCDAIHLDTGYTRHAAHRLYLNQGFQMTSHHMALAFAKQA